MTTTEQIPGERLAVAEAIHELDSLIRQHQSAARRVAIALGSAFVCLVAACVVLHSIETRMAIEVLTAFKAGAEALSNAPAAKVPANTMSDVNIFLQGTKQQVDAIAEHARTFGVQYYNALLLAGAAVFALVFGLLMAVYRFHLTEVSKLQNSKLAFMRVRVAMQTDVRGDQPSLIRTALLDRAFEYRSGREKQVESPLPGHPASDASALLVERLAEAVSKGRRET